jgi:RNAse (barnase) inhibitor barstar
VTSQVFELDGSRINDLDGFYAEVSRVLIPGTGWGRNLDAFDDILDGGFGTPEGGFTLVWRESEQSRRRLSHVETVRVLEQRLGRCHPSNRASVVERLAAARRGEGQTIFDDLLEIISRHPEIELVLK